MDAYKLEPTKRKGWSTRELVLVFLCVVFGIVAAALVVVVAINERDDETKETSNLVVPVTQSQNGVKSTNVYEEMTSTEMMTASASTETPPLTNCLTPTCIKTAASLLDAMDTDVNPCDDFYEYSCGKWIKNHIIPEDKSSLSRFGEVREDVQFKLKGLFESDYTNDLDAIKKAKIFYKSCLNEGELEKNAENSTISLINKLGGWPVLGVNNSFSVTDMLSEIVHHGHNFIIAVSTAVDERNVRNHTILVDQAPLGMGSRDYYLKSRQDVRVQLYTQFAQKVAEMFGAKPEDAENQMNDLVDFETEIANLTVPASKRRDANKLYNKMNLTAVQQSIPKDKFDWSQLLQGIYGKYNITITDEEEIIVYVPEYVEKVVDLVTNTDKRTVANYLIWRVVMGHLNQLPEKYRLLSKAFDYAMTGKKHPEERWKTCVSMTALQNKDAVGRLFVDNYFDNEAKIEVKELIQNVKSAFQKLVNTYNEWMDVETKVRANQKLKGIIEKIAYSDKIQDKVLLNADYEDITYEEDDFVKNYITSKKVFTDQRLQRLREDVDNTLWSIGASVVNAFYDPKENSITFPAGILQPPFYHKDYPKSLIYGGIGLVIGHEITHGFDDQGRKYDEVGNLKSWWTNSSSGAFDETVKCIIDQYSNYTIGNDSIRGENTQGENIADNGGLKAAYIAYNDWLNGNQEEFDRLPGLDLDHKKLFFINFAQGWCGKKTPQALHKQILSDPHSPGRYRIIGTLSNNEDFSKVFNCPLGSKMNPVHKCTVW